MLDTHSDQLSPGSVDKDFRGFTAIIGNSRSFPLVSQDGLPIRLGKLSYIWANKINLAKELSSRVNKSQIKTVSL